MFSIVSKKNYILLPCYFLFFMMLFVPTTYQPIKAALLVYVLTAICVPTMLKNRLNLHPAVLLWTFFMVSIGLFFMLRGAMNGAPGALRVGTVYVLWPLVYTVMVAGCSNKRVLNGLIKVLVVGTIAIGLYSLSYILYAVGLLPDFLYIPIEQGQAIGFYSGFIEYRLYNISTLLFTIPFLATALLVWPKDLELPVSRTCLWVAFILGMIMVLLSGRRALLLVVAMSPFIAVFFRLFLPKQIKIMNRRVMIQVFSGIFFIMIGLVIYLQWIYNFNIQSLVHMFMEGFDFQRSSGAIKRNMQFFALMDGWSQSPLLGAGHGAAVEYQRSVEHSWAYELSYIALLYHTGLVGIILYVSGIMWVFAKGIRLVSSGSYLGLQLLPVLVGTTCFLIANSTNPYLGKYDYIWIIFLPIAFINYWLLQRKQE